MGIMAYLPYYGQRRELYHQPYIASTPYRTHIILNSNSFTALNSGFYNRSCNPANPAESMNPKHVKAMVRKRTTTTTTTEKVDGLRSLHKQSSTLKSAKHSAKSSLAHAS